MTDAVSDRAWGARLRIGPVPLCRRPLPYAQRTVAQRVAGRVRAVWDVIAWTLVMVMALVSGSRLAGGVAPLVEPLRAALPLVVLPAYPIAAAAVLGRRWLQAFAAVLLCVVHVASLAPARARHAIPYWVGAAPTVRVASADVRVAVPLVERALADAVSGDPDVVVLTGLLPAVADVLRSSAVLAPYGERVVLPRADRSGVAVLSRLPIETRDRTVGLSSPVLRVRVAEGVSVELVPVDLASPSSPSSAKAWAAELRAVGRVVTHAEVPIVAVGDFHGTRWQPSFGALLAKGLVDAHETVGKGLSASWPMQRLRPLVRFDHALSDDRVFATGVTDLDVTGSDHRGFMVTYAIHVERPPGPSSG